MILLFIFLSALQATKIILFFLTFFSSLIAVIAELCPNEGPTTVFIIIIIFFFFYFTFF